MSKPTETEPRRKPDPHEGEQIRTCLWNLHCELADLPDLTVLPEEAERRLRCAMADVAEATRLCRLTMPEMWK